MLPEKAESQTALSLWTSGLWVTFLNSEPPLTSKRGKAMEETHRVPWGESWGQSCREVIWRVALFLYYPLMGSITFYLPYYIADFFSIGEMETSASSCKSNIPQKIIILNGFLCVRVKPGRHPEYGPFSAVCVHVVQGLPWQHSQCWWWLISLMRSLGGYHNHLTNMIGRGVWLGEERGRPQKWKGKKRWSEARAWCCMKVGSQEHF